MFSQGKQIKAVILDSLQANKVINIIEYGKSNKIELDEAKLRIKRRDVYIYELEDNIGINAKALRLCETSSATKDTIISNDAKIIKKQKSKNTFWKVVSGVLTGLLVFQSVR